VETSKRRRESRKEKTGVVAPLRRQMTSPRATRGLCGMVGCISRRKVEGVEGEDATLTLRSLLKESRLFSKTRSDGVKRRLGGRVNTVMGGGRGL
jgi:hypothetical protein